MSAPFLEGGDLPRPHPAWLARRRLLHRRFEEKVGLVDPSRVAYMRGPERGFSEEEMGDLWREALQGGAAFPGSANHVYVHVPFCKSICQFCNYQRLRPENADLLHRWLERVERSLSVLGPAVSSLRFHTLYIGGGTPSVLPSPLLSRLLEGLGSALRWHRGAVKQFELDPAVMTQDRVEVLARQGIGHFSFGIQTLDPAVNVAHNRGPQDLALVARRFQEFQDAGVSSVSCDFLLGLKGTTSEQMIGEIERVAATFQPSWIDIYFLTPTPSYVETHFGGSLASFFAHLAQFQGVPQALAAVAERTGYHLEPGRSHHLILRRTFPTHGFVGRRDRRFAYTQLAAHAGRPLHLLGLGSSARSQIFAHAAVAARDPGEDPSLPGPYTYHGHRLTLADEARNFLVARLRDEDRVGRREFQQTVGIPLEQAAPQAISAWKEEGRGSLGRYGLKLHPEDRLERIRTLLWLAPEGAMEDDLAQAMGLDLSAEGLDQALHRLLRGTPLPDGWTLLPPEHGHVLLLAPSGERVRVRVGPGLLDEEGIRFIWEEGMGREPPPGLVRALRLVKHELGRRASLRVLSKGGASPLPPA